MTSNSQIPPFPQQVRFEKSTRYEVPIKNRDNPISSPTIQPNVNVESTYESVGPADQVYDRKASNAAVNKKVSSPIEAPPLPPPLPPPLMKHHSVIRNANRDSNDSLDGSLDFSQHDGDSASLESDSGMEVVEEPTLRPSELVRGNNNRSMSIISGEPVKLCL